jgi:hypothetical protein
MVRLMNRWDDVQAKSLLDRPLKASLLRRQFEALRVQYGKLRLGDVLEGDGKTSARLRLHGQQGTVDVRLTLNPKNSRVMEVVFTRPRESAFVP